MQTQLTGLVTALLGLRYQVKPIFIKISTLGCQAKLTTYIGELSYLPYLLLLSIESELGSCDAPSPFWIAPHWIGMLRHSLPTQPSEERKQPSVTAGIWGRFSFQFQSEASFSDLSLSVLIFLYFRYETLTLN